MRAPKFEPTMKSVALVLSLLAHKPESEVVEQASRWLEDNVFCTSLNNPTDNLNNEGKVLSALLAVTPDEWLVQRADSWLARKSDRPYDELRSKIRGHAKKLRGEELGLNHDSLPNLSLPCSVRVRPITLPRIQLVLSQA